MTFLKLTSDLYAGKLVVGNENSIENNLVRCFYIDLKRSIFKFTPSLCYLDLVHIFLAPMFFINKKQILVLY